MIELLCTDRAYRGRGIGKLLMVAALAYSAVKDGKTAAVLTLGNGDDNAEAAGLYKKLGFEEMPHEMFSTDTSLMVQPQHVLVLWDIKRSLKTLKIRDFDGRRKGTRIPQLAPLRDDETETIQRLNSSDCIELVDRLADPRRSNES